VVAVQTFGELVRSRRRSLGWTQDELAARAGVSDRTVREIERNRRTSHRRNVKALVAALSLSEQEMGLFEGTARQGSEAISLRTEPATSSSGLSTLLTPLVNRERETEIITTMFQRPSRRLLTLTGPGGVGKTRLALRVAEDLRLLFADGVVVVGLGSLRHTSLVAPTIARALNVAETDHTFSVRHALTRYLRDKHLLLVLDNFEHVLGATEVLMEVLIECLDVKMLVTSREPLHIHGESEFPVPSLALPPTDSLPERAAIVRYGAVQLFVDRAQAVKPDFELTDANARDVALICNRLDGLPLAIELAAGRTKLLPPATLLARLDTRLSLLTGGGQDVPVRLQTLEGAISWSYDLLDSVQRTLFRHLAVFEGGCTLEAAEEICRQPDDGDFDVLERIGALVDKNLIRQIEQTNGTSRLLMLETIHEYGRARLTTSEEGNVVHNRHARYYLALVKEVNRHIGGPDQRLWLDRLEREHDNLRAALRWHAELGEPEIALELATALIKFWYRRGFLREGQHWLETLLARGVGVTALRAEALNGAGVLAANQGNFDMAATWFEESLDLYRTLGNLARQVMLLANLGCMALQQGAFHRAGAVLGEGLTLAQDVDDDAYARLLIHSNLGELALWQGDYTCARHELDTCLALARQRSDQTDLCTTLVSLGLVSHEQGNDNRARRDLEDGLALARGLGYKRGMSFALSGLGRLASAADDSAGAMAFCTEALALARTIGDMDTIVNALNAFATALCCKGAYAQARDVYQEGFVLSRAMDMQAWVVLFLEGLAAAELGCNNLTQATRFWGGAAGLRAILEVPIRASRLATHTAGVAGARARLGLDAFAVLWDEGVALAADVVDTDVIVSRG